jgi:hypothetical protein
MSDIINRSPVSYLPDTTKLQKANPDKRYSYVRRTEVDAFRDQGFEVYSDPKKEVKPVDGQKPVDTSVGTHDLVLMEIGGKAKEEYERGRHERAHFFVKAMEEKARELAETGQFQGRIDIRPKNK